jgi:hypothetical protein
VNPHLLDAELSALNGLGQVLPTGGHRVNSFGSSGRAGTVCR